MQASRDSAEFRLAHSSPFAVIYNTPGMPCVVVEFMVL